MFNKEEQFQFISKLTRWEYPYDVSKEQFCSYKRAEHCHDCAQVRKSPFIWNIIEENVLRTVFRETWPGTSSHIYLFTFTPLVLIHEDSLTGPKDSKNLLQYMRDLHTSSVCHTNVKAFHRQPTREDFIKRPRNLRWTQI